MTRRTLSAVFLWALAVGALACLDRGDSFRRCENGACENTSSDASCAEGAVECREGRFLAMCVRGQWTTRECELTCHEGRCVECAEDERWCNGEYTAVRCDAGRLVEAECVDSACVDGDCRCTPGVSRCTAAGRETCSEGGAWISAACDPAEPFCLDGRCVACSPGTSVCVDDVTMRACADDGTRADTRCGTGCDAATGQCRSCLPTSRRCRDASHPQVCDAEGRLYHDDGECEPHEECSEGDCVSSCVLAEQSASPAGCAFYGIAPETLSIGVVQTATGEVAPFTRPGDPGFPTRFHVLNPHPSLAAEAVARKGGTEIARRTIGAMGSAMFEVSSLVTDANLSSRVPDGSIEIVADRPVFVVQHLDAPPVGPGAEGSKAGDTSFLLPRHVLAAQESRYRVISQPLCTVPLHAQLLDRPGGFSIASTQSEPTLVQIEFSAPTAPGRDGDPPGYPAGPPAKPIVLQAGEAMSFLVTSGDLTGTLITADKPIAVFNGGLSRIPCLYTRHIQAQLQEQLMPVGLWSDAGSQHLYVGAARSLPENSPGEENDRWLVVTDEPQNEVTVAPVAGGTHTELMALPGSAFVFGTYPPESQSWQNPPSSEVHAVQLSERWFELISTKPVLIGRYNYLTGTMRTNTFTLERPVRFWRKEYLVQSVATSQNRLTLVVPTGADVIVDNAPLVVHRVPAYIGYESIHIDVAPGTHRVRLSAPGSLLVYGYTSPNETTGYSYAGPVGFGDGLN